MVTTTRFSSLLWALPALASALQILPPTLDSSQDRSDGSWSVESSSKTIYLESEFAQATDTDGLTLIPPTGEEFAALFQEDLATITGYNWTLQLVDQLPSNASGILLGAFTGDASEIVYENGAPTSEGYEIDITSSHVFIGGTGTRGMWWGTRTLLQMILVGDGTVANGKGTDAPAYATRGYMVDAGRKWYTKNFLKEMCSFASFFKMSEFHYHLSDNYPLNRGKNETWQDVYSHFSLLPEDEGLLGIIHGRENETLSRDDYADLQSHCAARGITVIPEIEAPGHCLYLTKWMPELALPKKDLLNLTHPDTIPTVQRIWEEFLPWFETKEVHVGADEYDPELADDYINFVNEMNSFINTTADKRIRIWGTYEPSDTLVIDDDIIIQHWQYGQSEPVELVRDGYEVVNSEDWWAYMGLKNDHMPILPAKYPQFFNESRVLNFANEDGWQWTPADYNPFNTTEEWQLKDGEPLNRGAIIAAWNDNGPDASTQLEMYYTMRRGIGLVGARAWTGHRGPEVTPESVAPSIDFFSPLAPGQNLDRVIASEGQGPLVEWARSNEDGEEVHLGQGSKGMNYTLTLNVTGPFELSSDDNRLYLDSEGILTFNADGYEYPLRHVTARDALELDPGHPGRIWVNVSSATHEPVTVSTPSTITIATDLLHGSVVWIDGEFAGRFEVFVYGGRNTQFSWSQMAFVAPLEHIEGTGLERLSIDGNVDFGNDDGTPPPPTTPPSGAAGLTVSFGMMAALTVMAVAVSSL